MRLQILFLGVVVLCQASSAVAQVTPQAKHTLWYRNITAVRINPLGLVNFTWASYRTRLYKSESDAFAQNYVGIGATAGISPAWGRIGLLAEVQPLTILRVYAQYEFFGYFGSFNQLASFPSASGDYSDSDISARGDQPGTESYATTGALLTLGATLQLKVGPIAVRNLLRAIHGNYSTRRGDRVYYDPIIDMLMPDNGWLLTNDVDVLGIIPLGNTQLAAGVRWSYSHSFYRSDHFTDGEDPSLSPNNDLHRLGPLIAWQLRHTPGARFDKPTIILIAQWHLKHRYRTGEDVSVALPYLGLAFSFQGDLL